MVGCAALVGLGLVGLGWAAEVVGVFVGDEVSGSFGGGGGRGADGVFRRGGEGGRWGWRFFVFMPWILRLMGVSLSLFFFFFAGFLGVEEEGGMEEGYGADDEDSASDGEEFDC